ncbi:hypothetical protein J2S44_005697 [Catenuloplanes niger]|uniref:Uncharacterized protein n=1 Tax=Catenuloplanes niger TaxID=587534 RepID=A0AAE3ZTA4_9ACTN|nr:hypothetical protein [Catenuloplanes niger]
MQPYADAPESRTWRAPVVPARRDGEMPSVGINPRPAKRKGRERS